MNADVLFAKDTAGLMPQAAWLGARRTAAAAAFQAKGVPNRRVEDWKYSDLKAALEAANDLESGTIAWAFDALPVGVEVLDLAKLTDAPDWVSACFGKSATEHAMAAASFTLARSGFALRVGPDVKVTEPLRLSFSGTGHARAVVVLEQGAALTLVETRPAGAGFSNIGIEIVLGAGAQLSHLRLADQAGDAIQIEDVAVRIAEAACYRAHLMNRGAKLSRTTLRVTLKGAGASADLSGINVLGGALHADVTTELYHATGNTRSTQLFKYVAGGKARSVYQGKVTVAQGADGSDSRQTAKGLLLSDRAEIDLKPELEIYADDVKCAHGAAVGDLDADSLFYLRARGVPEAEARNMLVHAFVADALEGIVDESLRVEVRAKVEGALAEASA
jgi:Fe-S cluster assembly protein SufD